MGNRPPFTRKIGKKWRLGTLWRLRYYYYYYYSRVNVPAVLHSSSSSSCCCGHSCLSLPLAACFRSRPPLAGPARPSQANQAATAGRALCSLSLAAAHLAFSPDGERYGHGRATERTQPTHTLSRLAKGQKWVEVRLSANLIEVCLGQLKANIYGFTTPYQRISL